MKSFTFNSSFNKKEIYLMMKELTDPKSACRLFVGNIREDGFSIMQHQPFSNNVLNPKIDVIITENKNTTDINIKASLNKCDRIGLFIIGITSCGIFTFLVSNAIVSSSLECLFPAIALLFFLILIFIISGLFFTLKTNKIVKIIKTKLT